MKKYEKPTTETYAIEVAEGFLQSSGNYDETEIGGDNTGEAWG